MSIWTAWMKCQPKLVSKIIFIVIQNVNANANFIPVRIWYKMFRRISRRFLFTTFLCFSVSLSLQNFSMNILNKLGIGSSRQTNMDPSPIAQVIDDEAPAPGNQFTQFGAGCFWSVELAYQRVPGVTQTEVGYSQGITHDPSYKDVCSGTTNHAEIVRVQYDPKECSYQSLLDLFWSKHDPTTLNRQVTKVLLFRMSDFVSFKFWFWWLRKISRVSRACLKYWALNRLKSRVWMM